MSIRLLVLALLLWCTTAAAQVERIDVLAGRSEAEITIRFAQRIGYLRHEVPGDASDLRIFLRLLDGKVSESSLMQATFQPPKVDRVPPFSVVYPELRNGMLVSFAQPTRHKVKAGKDGRSIVLTVPLLPSANGGPADTGEASAASDSTDAATPTVAAPGQPAPTAARLVSRAPATGTQPVSIGGTRITGARRSIKAMRDFGVVKQGYDYSCGAAALATLLTHGFADPVSEAEVLTDIVGRLAADQASQITKSGLSLLDLQQFAQRRGYRAQGFRIAADQVSRLARPVLVFIRPFGYEHFAIFKGVRGDRVLLADPSQGNWRMPLHRFLEMWLDDKGKGIVLAVERADGQWPADSPLLVAAGDAPRPEQLSLQQMLMTRPAPSPPTPVLNP